MTLLKTDKGIIAIIVLVSALLFLPFLGSCPLFDWDEINFAECAREMIVTNNYSQVQLNFQPFWEKPPFFIWLQALSMNVFGINEFAARFPNALCGILTLVILYLIGKSLNNKQFGVLWVLVYMGTLLPHFYFKSGIIDPWFNLFIFLSIYFLIRQTDSQETKKSYLSVLAGFFLGMAILTKGPAAILIVGLTVAAFFVLNRFRLHITAKQIGLFTVTFLLTGSLWFLIEIASGNIHVVNEFINYQIRLFKTEDSDHGGFLFYHFVVLLVGCFPSSLFLIYAHKSSSNDTPNQVHTKRWMLCLFWVVLLLFTIVKTKIVHYSSLCYFPLTYLAVYAIQKLIVKEWEWKKWLSISIIIIGGVLGIVFTAITFIDYIKPFLLKPGVINDEFAVENLKAQVLWWGWEWGVGVFFIAICCYAIVRTKTSILKAITVLYAGATLTIFLLIVAITPKVEQYSQHAAIEFYKSIANKNYYVETHAFKSYAYLFYTQKQYKQTLNADLKAYVKERSVVLEKEGVIAWRSYNCMSMEWMLHGNIDRPTFIVAKINDVDVVQEHYSQQLKELYRKNGFVFYIRYHSYKADK